MIIAKTIDERNAIEPQTLSVANEDGTWTVYQPDDKLPEQYMYAAEKQGE